MRNYRIALNIALFAATVGESSAQSLTATLATIESVPDSGATIAMLGAALGAIEFIRRKLG